MRVLLKEVRFRIRSNTITITRIRSRRLAVLALFPFRTSLSVSHSFLSIMQFEIRRQTIRLQTACINDVRASPLSCRPSLPIEPLEGFCWWLQLTQVEMLHFTEALKDS